MEAFRPTERLRYAGNPEELAWLRQAALRELDTMRRENTFDLPLYARTVRLPGGERIECRRIGLQDSIRICAPTVGRRPPSRAAARASLSAAAGTFYAIPQCVARYEGLTSLVNAIPDGPLASWSLGLGTAVTVKERGELDLTAAQGLPEAGLDREVGVFVLPGGPASGLLFGRAHIPDAAPFSVSCLLRLREPLSYDYSYDDRNVLNPFRTYFLQTQDGSTFTWDCPGSISPVLGFCSPHLHPQWSETVTYPWAPWNADFTRQTEWLAGAKRLDAPACDEAPVLAGEGYVDALGRAYPFPYGFILGLQAAGLFVYNGNRLLGARISDFDSQTGYSPPVTDALEIGVWYHAVFTHDGAGTARVYLAKQNSSEAWVFCGDQPLCAMDAACQYTLGGINAWTLHNGTTGAAIGAYRMNPVMDVALPRFFHYALSADQAYLLQMEALDGLFVADDHETAQAEAMGLTPILVE